MKQLIYPETKRGMRERLKDRLGGLIPHSQLARLAEIALEIHHLKRLKRAVILGHNYMTPELYHSVPDFTGDSLFLSQVAAQSKAEVIVFCGVRFMAETAKILNPDRLVLLPTRSGGCSLAASITAADIRTLRGFWPEVPVVSYVNTYADAKAETDVCCTSANAVDVVRSLRKQGHRNVIFLPDQHLARNVAQEVGMKVLLQPEAEDAAAERALSAAQDLLITWPGKCEVHDKFTVEDITFARERTPGIQVLAHPECRTEVVAAADFTGSTTALIRKVGELEGGACLLLTECSMARNIPPASIRTDLVHLFPTRCPHMAEITLESTLEALRGDMCRVDVPRDVSEQARASLERMISSD